MISLEKARSIITAHVLPLGSVVTPLDKAHGRVLRQEIIAREDFPGFDRSAMDGYAVAFEDSSSRFQVVGEVRPGQLPALTLHAGECARIFTGAQMPQGATHVRRKGEDVHAGDVLLRPGTRLRAAEASLLAQLGVTLPKVSPPPRVVHLVSGDELVLPSGKPGPGQIRDSNSTLVAGLIAEAGARLVHQRRCKDDVAALVREVKLVPPTGWDLLLISGGASVGDYDFGNEALTKLGFHLHFQGINLRPGKPLIFGTRGRQVAFVIPGNPVAHFVVFHTAIRLALEALEGIPTSFALAEVALACELPGNSSPRETFWPARLAVEGGRLQVDPLGWHSSGDLCALASVNALVQVLAGSPSVAAGELVRCLLLDSR